LVWSRVPHITPNTVTSQAQPDVVVDIFHVVVELISRSPLYCRHFSRGEVVLIDHSQGTTIHNPVHSQDSIQNGHLALISLRKLEHRVHDDDSRRVLHDNTRCEGQTPRNEELKKGINLFVFRSLSVTALTSVQISTHITPGQS
jgi:hypothetical protein